MAQAKTIGTVKSPVIIAAPFGPDAIRAMGAHKPPQRSGGTVRRARAGEDAVSWPEGLRTAARALEFKLANSLPVGMLPESEEWKLAEPVPNEVRRGTPGALILNEFIHGTYNGFPIQDGPSLAKGGTINLEILLNILSVNAEIYDKNKTYHKMSGLMGRVASAAGRYVLINESGDLTLTNEKPETKRSKKAA